MTEQLTLVLTDFEGPLDLLSQWRNPNFTYES